MPEKIKRKPGLKEIPHNKLKGDPQQSGRYTEIGYTQEKGDVVMTLVDKIIYPINKCPACASTNTFHKRVQMTGDIVGNVFNFVESTTQTGHLYMKFDYCLSCHKQFVIEIYIWKHHNKKAN